MKLTINQKNALQLIKGASIFTTGGGVPYDDQITTINQLPRLKSSIYSLNEFPKAGYLSTAAELGPTDVPPLEKTKVIKPMLKLLTKTTGKKIVGLYPPEIGQESIILESAHHLKLPIADFDPVGFRAVPYIDINIFNLKKLPFSYTPMTVASDQGEIFLLDGQTSYERLETILRSMTQLSKSKVIYLLGGLLSVKQLIKNRLENSSYSQAFNFGAIEDFSSLIKKLKPLLIIKGTVTKKKTFKQPGFLGEIITIKDNNQQSYRLIVLNEVLFIFNQKNQLLAQVPQRILLIDSQKLRGLSCVFLKKGSPVSILILPPEKHWRSQKAQKLFGPKRFSTLLKNLRKIK